MEGVRNVKGKGWGWGEGREAATTLASHLGPKLLLRIQAERKKTKKSDICQKTNHKSLLSMSSLGGSLVFQDPDVCCDR